MGSPTEEDKMACTLAAVTCPLCGLGFANPALLELHLREDHRRRRGRPTSRKGPPGDRDPARERAGDPVGAAGPPRRPAPPAHTVLAVTARSGQESPDLGLLLYAF